MVLAAFVLISLFDAANTVGDNINREANSLVAVRWAADSLPEATRTKVEELSRSYASIVVDEEWPRMRNAESVGNGGWETLNRLRETIAVAETDNAWQEDRKTEAANQLWQVYEARQARLEAATNSVSTVLWFALVIGTILSLLFPYLFGGSTLTSQLIFTVTLSATLTLLLFAIYQMQNPFSGGVSIEPDAFTSVVEHLH